METTRAIVRAISDGIRNGQVGRRLERLLGGAGLVDIRVQGVGISQPFEFFRMVTAGNLAEAERRGALPPGTGDAWWPALEVAARGRHEGGLLGLLDHPALPRTVRGSWERVLGAGGCAVIAAISDAA